MAEETNNALPKSAIVIAILALAIGGFLIWKYGLNKKAVPARSVEEAATAGVLPEITPIANPVGDKLPELNPVQKANPFKDIYKNPFE